MQRKAEENEPPSVGERLERLGLRRHATAKRFPAREERLTSASLTRRCNGSPHRRVRNLGRVDTLEPALHVRKLITQRRDAPLRQSVCDGLHLFVRHSGACTVRKDQAGTRAGRYLPEPGYGLCAFDRDADRFAAHTPTIALQSCGATPGRS